MGMGKGWHGNTAGHRRAAIKGLIKSGKRPSMFFEGGSPMYSKIVTFESSAAASRAAGQLLAEFDGAVTRTKHRRVLRVTVLAANRAAASAKKRGLDPAVKRRFIGVADIYRNAAEGMKRAFAIRYPK